MVSFKQQNLSLWHGPAHFIFLWIVLQCHTWEIPANLSERLPAVFSSGHLTILGQWFSAGQFWSPEHIWGYLKTVWRVAAGGVCQWYLIEASDGAPRAAVPRTAFRAQHRPVGNASSAAADKPWVSSGPSELSVCGARWGSLYTSFLHVT